MINTVTKILLAATLAASTLAVKTDNSISAVESALAQTSALAMEADSRGDGNSGNPYPQGSELNYAYNTGFYNGYTNARAT